MNFVELTVYDSRYFCEIEEHGFTSNINVNRIEIINQHSYKGSIIIELQMASGKSLFVNLTKRELFNEIKKQNNKLTGIIK